MTTALRRGRTCGIVVAAIAVWTSGACGQGPATQNGDAATLAVQVRFTSMWWSEAQMEGLNPNNPPPKNTEVELSRWEYTDPIGVPHPDVVNAVITLVNHGKQSIADLGVVTEGEWKIGPLDDESRARWEGVVTLAKTEERFQVPPESKHTIRTSVDLKQMMNALEAKSQWPYMLRVTVTVQQAAAKQSLARTQVEFPIRPGN